MDMYINSWHLKNCLELLFIIKREWDSSIDTAYGAVGFYRGLVEKGVPTLQISKNIFRPDFRYLGI